ncbi:MAG: sugar phosphate isomerase/epimerase family protein [Bryobacteraceae bacterium]
MRRRDFLISSAITSAAAAKGWGQSSNRADPDRTKLNRIGIMTLSFNSVLKSPSHPEDPKRTLDILDAPQMIADRYGVHHVEFQHTHFASTEPSYLKEVRDRLRKAKSNMNQICLEFGSLNISTPDPAVRIETIDLTKQWIDHAVEIGCPRVMLNHGTLAPEVRQNAIAALKTIGDYGNKKKVCVTLESRGHSVSTTNPSWEVVVEVVKAAGIHANPDTGNFPDEAARHAGLRAMYPLSCGSSHAHYDPQRYSEADAIAISKELGYKGLYSIEATPVNGPDPYVAVQTIIDELLKDI